MGINLFMVLAAYLKPVLPTLAAQAESFLNIAPQVWPSTAMQPLCGHQINEFKALMTRVEADKILLLLMRLKTI
jgi:Methionyl-tRNA synthetase